MALRGYKLYHPDLSTALPSQSNWVSYIQIPITNRINTNQIVDFNPPAGMTLIPFGPLHPWATR